MIWITIAIILGGIVLLDLVVRLCFSRLILRVFESKLPLDVSPSRPEPTAERIAFPTSDGLTLRGSLHGLDSERPKGLIVFCPELNANHWSATRYCRGLLDDGFVVLSFDFRNQGESDSLAGYEPLHWVTDHEVRDVAAALEYAQFRDDLRELPLGLMGISRGGGTALAAAAGQASIKAVLVEGAFSTAAMHLHYTLRWASMYVPRWFLKLVPAWHLKSTLHFCRWISQRRRCCRYTPLERLLPQLSNRPVLMIAGCHDSYVPLEVPESMSARINGTNCELWKVADAKHNRARRVDAETYDRRVTDFFRQELAPHHDEFAVQDSQPDPVDAHTANAYQPDRAHQPASS